MAAIQVACPVCRKQLARSDSVRRHVASFHPNHMMALTSPWIEGTCRKKKLFNWHNSWGSSLRNLRPCCYGKPHVVKDIQDGCLHPRWRCKVTWHTSRSFFMWNIKLYNVDFIPPHFLLWNTKLHNVEFIPQLCKFISTSPWIEGTCRKKKVENNWHSSLGSSLFVCWI